MQELRSHNVETAKKAYKQQQKIMSKELEADNFYSKAEGLVEHISLKNL